MLAFYCSMLTDAEERDLVEEIYLQYRGLIKYVALAKLNDVPLAEDAVHEVMLVVIANVKRLQGRSREEIKSFLYLVTRNVAVDLLRKEKRRAAENIEELTVAGGLDPQQQVGERAVLECINAMPPIYRDVLELTLCFGYTAKEAARLLRISPAAARKRLERARALVRSALTEGEMSDV